VLRELKRQVYEANMRLPALRLVAFTWGNASGIDRERGLFVIKPSGVPYEKLTADDMVVMDLEGNKAEGRLNPSSDTPTHLALYNRFADVGGIVHTHSRWATIWAQACRPIPAYGTTHADYFHGPVPCCRALTRQETADAYEHHSGVIIAEHFEQHGLNPLHLPGALLQAHGPFAWGKDADEAVFHAAVLEEIAMMAFHTELVPQSAGQEMPSYILDKHFERKHGPNAYYGQKSGET